MENLAPAGGFLVLGSLLWLAWHFLRGHHGGHHRGVGFGNALAGFVLGGATVFGGVVTNAMADGAGAGANASSAVVRHDTPTTTTPPTPAPPPAATESRP